jgi:large subunit ribosomal protein L18Ae
MRVFARDAVLARSKFWYHMVRQHKVRRVQGEIVSTNEIHPREENAVRNYGIVLRYQTRTVEVNMYKEYRAVTLNDAVSQMFIELSGRHQARPETVQIIRTSVVATKALRRPQTIQYADVSCRFPKTDNRKRAPMLALRTTFKATRPTLA